MANEIMVLSRNTVTQIREGRNRSLVLFNLLFVYDLRGGIKDSRGQVVKLSPASELPNRAVEQNWLAPGVITALNEGLAAAESELFQFGPGTTLAQMLVVARVRYAEMKDEFIARSVDEFQLAGLQEDAE